MQAYAKKVQNIIRDMLIRPTIAKSPTSVSSLTTPSFTNISSSEGFIKQNEAAYRISAINEYGETISSPEAKITISTSLSPVDGISGEYAPGYLEKGVYYYSVTAVNENGETNIVNVATISVRGVPRPVWSANPYSVTLDGMLPAGTYYYSVTAVKDGKETEPTDIEVLVNQDHSSVTLEFNAVEGADSYNLYGRERNSKFRILNTGSVIYVDENQKITVKDTGNILTGADIPLVNTTTAGVKLSWQPVEGNVKYYRIYGRLSPNKENLQKIDEVPGNINYYIDAGEIEPSGAAPTTNMSGSNSGSSVELTWDPVPNATGYRIYGRNPLVEKQQDLGDPIVEENKGYLTTIPDGNITTWIDSGSIDPDYSIVPPSADSTDGTMGVLGSVIPDGDTLTIDSRGLLSIKGNVKDVLGNMNIVDLDNNHIIVYSKTTNKWINLDPKMFFTSYIASISPTTVDGRVVIELNPDDLESVSTNLADSLLSLKDFNTVTDELKSRIEKLEARVTELEGDIGMPSDQAASKSRMIEEPTQTETKSTKKTKKA